MDCLYCSRCGLKIVTPEHIQCPTCDKARYCSVECKDEHVFHFCDKDTVPCSKCGKRGSNGTCCSALCVFPGCENPNLIDIVMLHEQFYCKDHRTCEMCQNSPVPIIREPVFSNQSIITRCTRCAIIHVDKKTAKCYLAALASFIVCKRKTLDVDTCRKIASYICQTRDNVRWGWSFSEM